MRNQDIGNAELTHRLGWYMPQLDRVLDLRHRLGMGMMDTTLGSLRSRLHVSDVATSVPAVTVVTEGMGDSTSS